LHVRRPHRVGRIENAWLSYYHSLPKKLFESLVYDLPALVSAAQ